MKEWCVNIYLIAKTFKGLAIIGGVGSTWHERDGSEQDKVEFLQSQVENDRRKAKVYQLPERLVMVDVEGTVRERMITYPSFQLLSQQEQMKVYEETVFKHFADCPQNPVIVVTPILDGKIKIEATMDFEKPLYWIAINGSSCARYPLPLFRPRLKPVPEILIGFKTSKEAAFAQDKCLNAPIEEVRKLMESWCRFGSDVKVVRSANQEPQTYGPTLWTEGA